MLNRKVVSKAAFTLMGVLAVACGTADKQENKSGGETTVVDSSKPSDSTGGVSNVSVGFATSSQSSAALFGLLEESADSASTLDLGNGIVLSDARLSIAAIKINAEKDPSEPEKSLESEAKAAEKARVAREEQEDKQDEATVAALDLAKPEDKGGMSAAKETEREKRRTERHSARKLADEADLEIAAKKDKNIRYKGPYVYDLVKKSVSPELPKVELADGSYKRIEFKLKPNRVLADTDALANRSLYLGGTVLLDGKQVPFKISYHIAENIRLNGDAGVKLESGVSSALVVAFDVKAWFKDVDLSKATKDASGAIVVDKTNNKEILKAIHKNLKSSTRFGKDEDGNKEISSSEAKGDGKASAEEKTTLDE